MNILSNEVPAVADGNRLDDGELQLLEQKILAEGLSFSQMKDLVELSSQREREYVIKVVNGKNGTKVTYVPQQRSVTSPIYSLLKFGGEGEVCLSSHTHYKTNEDGYIHELSCLLSDPDFDTVMISGRESDDALHLGSYFLPNPYGITFIVNSHEVKHNRSVDFRMQWYLLEKESVQSLGELKKIDREKLNVNKIMAFTAIRYPQRISFDLLFVPYVELDRLNKEEGIELEEILFGSGLPKLIKGTVFEDRKINEHRSIVDVVRSSKTGLRKLGEDDNGESEKKHMQIEKKKSDEVLIKAKRKLVGIMNMLRRKNRQM